MLLSACSDPRRSPANAHDRRCSLQP
jgi:hypothetical protein